MIRFTTTATKPGQHAIGDTKAPKRFNVLIDGVKVGEVYTKSRESRTASTGRIAGRLRGYTRSWVAVDNDGEQVGWSDSRDGASEPLTAKVAH